MPSPPFPAPSYLAFNAITCGGPSSTPSSAIAATALRISNSVVGVGDQDHRHRTIGVPAGIAALLQDRFKAYAPFRHAGGDNRRRTGPVHDLEADVIAALMALHRRTDRLFEFTRGTAECGDEVAARQIDNVTHHC